jgi:tetratricopeptide (TPR) repeat protein
VIATRSGGGPARSVTQCALAVLILVASAGAPAHGPLEEQIEKVTAEIARDPTNTQLYVRRGELRRVHEEWDAALADYRRASVLAPADDRIDFLRGRALQEAGRPAQAKAALVDLAARVQADFNGGVRSGVNGTPTFYVNGVRVDTGFSYDELLAALEEALEATKGR